MNTTHPNVETRAMARRRRAAEANETDEQGSIREIVRRAQEAHSPDDTAYHPYAACGGFGYVPEYTIDEGRDILEKVRRAHGEEMNVDKEASTHNYKTKPIIIKLENGTTFRGQTVSLSDVNVSEYLK